MRSGQAVFSGIRDQAVPFLWDQGPEFVTLLESRIRNLGSEMGSAMKNITRYDPAMETEKIPGVYFMKKK